MNTFEIKFLMVLLYSLYYEIKIRNNLNLVQIIYIFLISYSITVYVIDRMGAVDSIVHLLYMFAEGFLSLIVYCCNSRPIFRLCVSAVMVIN